VVFLIEHVSKPTQDVCDLILTHCQAMQSLTPDESCHVMDTASLFDFGTQVFVLKDGGESLGMAAIKTLDAQHAELKSMHTKSAARGRGVANALLVHALDHARDLGLTRLSLETGADEAFEPARRLYQRHGFDYCAPFGNYTHDPLSVFMTRAL
jgi:putative acetyltransferase